MYYWIAETTLFIVTKYSQMQKSLKTDLSKGHKARFDYFDLSMTTEGTIASSQLHINVTMEQKVQSCRLCTLVLANTGQLIRNFRDDTWTRFCCLISASDTCCYSKQCVTKQCVRFVHALRSYSTCLAAKAMKLSWVAPWRIRGTAGSNFLRWEADGSRAEPAAMWRGPAGP